MHVVTGDFLAGLWCHQGCDVIRAMLREGWVTRRPGYKVGYLGMKRHTEASSHSFTASPAYVSAPARVRREPGYGGWPADTSWGAQGTGAPDTEGQSRGSAFLITFSKAEGPQWQWRRWSAGTSRFPGREGLSQEGGLFPRTGESFPGDRPQHAQFPVGKYLKIGNYRIASVIITLRWNSPCYDSYCLLVRNHVDSEITASRRGWPVSGSTCQVSSHSTALSLARSLETMGLCAGAEAKKLEGNLHASSTPPPTPPPRCLLFCFQIGWVQWLTPPPSSLC